MGVYIRRVCTPIKQLLETLTTYPPGMLLLAFGLTEGKTRRRVIYFPVWWYKTCIWAEAHLRSFKAPKGDGCIKLYF